jgi:hypothetical protein
VGGGAANALLLAADARGVAGRGGGAEAATLPERALLDDDDWNLRKPPAVSTLLGGLVTHESDASVGLSPRGVSERDGCQPRDAAAAIFCCRFGARGRVYQSSRRNRCFERIQ